MAAAAERPARALGAGRLGPIEPAAELDLPPAQEPEFEGVPDSELLAPLRTGKIVAVKFNTGGSSVSLRIDFDNGARAAFKPRQINTQTVPRHEIAAYRINRLLGLRSVAPAIGRSFKAADILSAVVAKSRHLLPRMRREMIIDSGGVVSGELSWWIPVIQRAFIEGFPLDTTDGIVTWKRYLSQARTIPRRHKRLLAQISDMLVFDFVINNVDRWSGGNARISNDRKNLYYMDNTLAFGISPDGHTRSRIYIARTQKFSRTLIGRLRGLTRSEIRGAVAADRGPFEYLLSPREIGAALARRDYVLRYVDALIAQHGEEAVLLFP